MPTNRIPLIVDVSGTPVVREIPNAGDENVVPRVLAPATSSTNGAMSAADKVALDGTPAAISSAVAAEATARTAAIAAEASTRSSADSALATSISDEATARAAADSAEATARAAGDTAQASALSSHAAAGGTAHPEATTSTAGFLSGGDKTKLDALDAARQLPAGGTTGYALKKLSGTDYDVGWAPDQTGGGSTPLYDGTPEPVGTPTAGDSTDAARGNHVHAHGNQAGGGLHADATTSTAGFLSAADKVALDGVPAAISSAVAAEATARTAAIGVETAARIAADSAEATTRADDDATLAGLISDEATTRSNADAALSAAIADLDGANLDTAAPLTPPEEVGLFAQRNASALEFRTVHPGADLEVALLGDSVRIARRPALWTPPRSRRSRGYRDVRRQGVRTAGAVGDTTRLADNHGSAHLFPYMLWAGVDWYGFPHNRHKRLESSSLGNDSGELGYEFGHDLARGDFRDGRALKWSGSGRAENAGWADAFWDWALEINPEAGEFAGDHLLRMFSGPLGATWSGELPFDWEVTLRSEGFRSYSVAGRWTIYSGSGSVLREWRAMVGVDSGFDFLAEDARVQLRWRVDRDQATRANTFDATNQGANQGADRLRCSVRNYGIKFEGFPKD